MLQKTERIVLIIGFSSFHVSFFQMQFSLFPDIIRLSDSLPDAHGIVSCIETGCAVMMN
ncbi:MAG: hypothetical protein IJ242_14345 [Clostridia bacterium]|nr:hypothetical protein [Clostridia bacterium]